MTPVLLIAIGFMAAVVIYMAWLGSLLISIEKRLEGLERTGVLITGPNEAKSIPPKRRMTFREIASAVEKRSARGI